MTAAHPKPRNALIVAFHFPPQKGSSGLLRALKFARYLPEFGWRPTVLTAHLRAYEAIETRGTATVPSEFSVIRAQAWDTKRHFGIRGHYFRLLALPDRWISWLLGAIPAGLWAIRRHKIDVIFSTFPIASAVLLGYVLHRLSGKRWVLDLRDSMTEENYPRDARTRRVSRWIERKAIYHADRIVFTAPSTVSMYLNRYPELRRDKCLLIPNGFDEEDFSGLVAQADRKPSEQPLILLHTGLLYPEERDPRPFFRALAHLKREGRIDSSSLKVVFRAAGAENIYQDLVDQGGISDLVKFDGHIPYRQSLQECAEADGLLLFQAANCDHQIPAKAYEYLRIRKPVFALTTRTGDTARLLSEVGGATIANLADEGDIRAQLPRFLDSLRAATHPLPDAQRIQRYARRHQAQQLAKCFGELLPQAAPLTATKAESATR